ncbi:hypothetical protein B0H17DRAFT_1207528 [Mycena rosella]|uniref:Uncharacterized protein n=1 Tax=Mycena rosella TaxID=1033263 RepID=A0AAD7GBR9_MYCRO|nr:hypothetical protein B0H17DRAFT_1207528 [Mycena rosella]
MAVTRFYDNITKLYLLKYGYDMLDDEDLEEDIEDPTDPNAILPGSLELSEEEEACRAKIFNSLRGENWAWYRSKFGGGLEESQWNKMQLAHFYSKIHYEERIKACFEAAWEVEVQRALHLEAPAPEKVKIWGKVTRAVMAEESPEMLAELKVALDKQHAGVVRAWEMGCAEVPLTTKEEMSA